MNSDGLCRAPDVMLGGASNAILIENEASTSLHDPATDARDFLSFQEKSGTLGEPETWKCS